MPSENVVFQGFTGKIYCHRNIFLINFKQCFNVFSIIIELEQAYIAFY